MRELTMPEAWEISRAIRAELGPAPTTATNGSVIAEHEAIDAALLPLGIVPQRSDQYGNCPEGNTWWVGQRESGFMTGRSGVTQAEIAVCLSLHQDVPLRWLVPDPDYAIHRRYFPKPATPKTNWIFPLTDGPMLALPVETSLFDLLGGEWAA